MNLTATPFSLDPRLAAEAAATLTRPHALVILRDEARFPWLVVVPRRSGVKEVFDLLPSEQTALWALVSGLSQTLRTETGAAKINIAAFGNMVPQLHIHIVARREEDPAWPGSAVGFGERQPYGKGAETPRWWERLCQQLGGQAEI